MKDNRDIVNPNDLVFSQQADFVKLLFQDEFQSPYLDQRGVDIYKKNIRLTAKNALSISFPTVIKLIGDSYFLYLSTMLLKAYPPKEGDWADWGTQFPRLLRNIPELKDYPYIADSAQLDLLRHRVDRASDIEYQPESLPLLSTASLDNIVVNFADTVRVLEAEYPVIEIWYANHTEDKGEYIRQFQLRLTEGQGQQFVQVYRVGFVVHMRELGEMEYYWLQYLMRGDTIGHSLDALDERFNKNSDDGFQFELWLPRAIESQLISSLSLKP